MSNTTKLIKPEQISVTSDKRKHTRMKALVYHGAGKKAWEEKPIPIVVSPTDAIVKILKTTICGSVG